jgi:hypothetical protein
MARLVTPAERAAAARLLGIEDTDDNEEFYTCWTDKLTLGRAKGEERLLAIDGTTFAMMRKNTLASVSKLGGKLVPSVPTMPAALAKLGRKTDDEEKKPKSKDTPDKPTKAPIISPLVLSKKIDLSEAREIKLEKTGGDSFISVSQALHVLTLLKFS